MGFCDPLARPRMVGIANGGPLAKTPSPIKQQTQNRRHSLTETTCTSASIGNASVNSSLHQTCHQIFQCSDGLGVAQKPLNQRLSIPVLSDNEENKALDQYAVSAKKGSRKSQVQRSDLSTNKKEYRRFQSDPHPNTQESESESRQSPSLAPATSSTVVQVNKQNMEEEKGSNEVATNNNADQTEARKKNRTHDVNVSKLKRKETPTRKSRTPIRGRASGERAMMERTSSWGCLLDPASILDAKAYLDSITISKPHAKRHQSFSVSPRKIPSSTDKSCNDKQLCLSPSRRLIRNLSLGNLCAANNGSKPVSIDKYMARNNLSFSMTSKSEHVTRGNASMASASETAKAKSRIIVDQSSHSNDMKKSQSPMGKMKRPSSLQNLTVEDTVKKKTISPRRLFRKTTSLRNTRSAQNEDFSISSDDCGSVSGKAARVVVKLKRSLSFNRLGKSDNLKSNDLDTSERGVNKIKERLKPSFQTQQTRQLMKKEAISRHNMRGAPTSKEPPAGKTVRINSAGRKPNSTLHQQFAIAISPLKRVKQKIALASDCPKRRSMMESNFQLSQMELLLGIPNQSVTVASAKKATSKNRNCPRTKKIVRKANSFKGRLSPISSADKADPIKKMGLSVNDMLCKYDDIVADDNAGSKHVGFRVPKSTVPVKSKLVISASALRAPQSAVSIRKTLDLSVSNFNGSCIIGNSPVRATLPMLPLTLPCDDNGNATVNSPVKTMHPKSSASPRKKRIELPNLTRSPSSKRTDKTLPDPSSANRPSPAKQSTPKKQHFVDAGTIKRNKQYATLHSSMTSPSKVRRSVHDRTLRSSANSTRTSLEKFIGEHVNCVDEEGFYELK